MSVFGARWRMLRNKSQPPRTTPTRKLRAKKAPKKQRVYTDLAAYTKARGGIPTSDYGDD